VVKIMRVGCWVLRVDGMGYVSGIIDSCALIKANRVRVLCPPGVLERLVTDLDSHMVPYKVQGNYLTINREEGLVLLYGHYPLVCTLKRAALRKIVSRICLGGIEPYQHSTLDSSSWVRGVMDVRGGLYQSGNTKWYSITHTDTDLVDYLGRSLSSMGVDYKLYTVERENRKTLFNTRIYKLAHIERLLTI
jgi:hypothetical protein